MFICSWRQQILLPPTNFGSNSFHNIRQHLIFWPTPKSWKAQVFPKITTTRNPSEVGQRELQMVWGIGAEESSRFVKIDALPRRITVLVENIHQGVTFLHVSFEKKKMDSFAKRIWDIGGQDLAILIPESKWLSKAFCIREFKASVRIMKRYGERGSPCLRPLCWLV